MAHLSIDLLGGFQARLGSHQPLKFQTRKAQALLAYLALPVGRAHPRDKLAALLWGEMSDQHSRNNLRQTLFDLRKVLGADANSVLHAQGETVALDPAEVDLDVAAFVSLAEKGAPEALEQAAAFYRGELLEGMSVKEEAFETWLMHERESLRELAMQALAKLLSHQNNTGNLEAAVRTAHQLLALDPLQEAVHCALMRSLAKLGRRGAALRQYQRCVATLQRELGVEPVAETRQLYQEILQHRVSPAMPIAAAPDLAIAATPAVVAVASPDSRSAETLLVGRETEMARLQDALDRANAGSSQLVALVGEAGIGKSRIVEELIGCAVRQHGRVLLGRAYESNQILPFGPWIDAFRTGQLAQDREVIEAPGAIWRGELARLLPEISVPGRQLPTGPLDYWRLFESVVQVIKQLSARQTLLLVLEDLHWADEMSLRLLAFLRRRLQHDRVLAVVTVREEEIEDAPVLHRTLEDLANAQRLLWLGIARLSQPDTVTQRTNVSRDTVPQAHPRGNQPPAGTVERR